MEGSTGRTGRTAPPRDRPATRRQHHSDPAVDDAAQSPPFYDVDVASPYLTSPPPRYKSQQAKMFDDHGERYNRDHHHHGRPRKTGNRNDMMIHAQQRDSRNSKMHNDNDRRTRYEPMKSHQRNVLIIGNSQIEQIDPEKFSRNVKLQKVTKYTVEQVDEWLWSD